LRMHYQQVWESTRPNKSGKVQIIQVDETTYNIEGGVDHHLLDSNKVEIPMRIILDRGGKISGFYQP